MLLDAAQPSSIKTKLKVENMVKKQEKLAKELRENLGISQKVAKKIKIWQKAVIHSTKKKKKTIMGCCIVLMSMFISKTIFVE